MKRLAVAVFCALLLHAGLFWIGPDWYMGATAPPTLSRFVTVTMSYRPSPEKAAGEEETPAQPHDTPSVEKTEKPASATVVKKSLSPRVAKPDEPGFRQEEGEVGEQGSPDAPSPEEAGSDAAMVREAFPLYKVNTPPRYPRSARRRGQQGTVVLSVYVDEQGRVAKLRLLDSSGHRALDNAALQAVKDWIFEPGVQGGTKAAMWVKVPVRFVLR
jgi:protein TonB